jgi:hypothetical protein
MDRKTGWAAKKEAEKIDDGKQISKKITYQLIHR